MIVGDDYGHQNGRFLCQMISYDKGSYDEAVFDLESVLKNKSELGKILSFGLILGFMFLKAIN